MAQYQITVDSQLLQQLFLGNSQDSGVAKLLESVLNQVLQAQATEQLSAEPYERTDERQGYRNGTYPHQLTTRVGTITLRVPRIRNGKFSTEMFARYQRSEQALVLALMEMVVNGVSTRKIAQITEELCGTEFSKSTVSELCIRTHFQGVTWQRCQTHFMRNILDATPKQLQEELYPRVRAILDAPDLETARLLLQQTVETYEAKASKAISVLENGFDDATAVLLLPEKYRKRLRTTNGMERLNEEIRRRECHSHFS
ncbi:transposase [Aneurinibacillus thermoaerophilus]